MAHVINVINAMHHVQFVQAHKQINANNVRMFQWFYRTDTALKLIHANLVSSSTKSIQKHAKNAQIIV